MPTARKPNLRLGCFFILGLLNGLLNGCYSYPPIVSQSSLPASGHPDYGSTPDQTETEKQLKSATEHCMAKHPETKGHKAEQVRCIITSTDQIWDRVQPEDREYRKALGDYAVQLAERQDRGEISKEQAENLYMQFMQQTPGLGIPPKAAR